MRRSLKRTLYGLSIFGLSTIFLFDNTQAFQVRQDKTPLDDRIVVDPVATMNGDTIPLDSPSVAAVRRAGWDRLNMNATSGWRVYLDRKSGAPMLVDGAGLSWAAAKGPSPTLEGMESSLRKFLRDNRDILLAHSLVTR